MFRKELILGQVATRICDTPPLAALRASRIGLTENDLLRGRRRPFDPRVLGAIVGRKLFGELRVEIPRHLVQCFTNGRP